MGNCKYCGEKAGFLKSKHSECHEKYLDEQEIKLLEEQQKKLEIKNRKDKLLLDYFEPSSNRNLIKKELDQIFSENEKNEAELKEIFQRKLESIMDERLPTLQDWEISDSFETDFGIPLDSLPVKVFAPFGIYMALSEFLKGNIHHELKKGREEAVVNYEKNEYPLFLIENTALLKVVKTKQYVGGSTGYSVRVMKGLWLRQSSYRGSPIENSELKIIDKGTFIVASKNIYFKGTLKSFKKKLNKIVSIGPTPGGDGGLSIFIEGKEDPIWLSMGIDKEFTTLACNCVSKLQEI